MTAEVVNLNGEVCIQFPCDACGKPVITGLDGLGRRFKCRKCGAVVTTPAAPCHYASCSGYYRWCNGRIEVLPAEEELRQAEARAWESRQDELRELEKTAAPTDDYREAMGDLRGSVHAEAMSSTARYRCARCGREYSWRHGSQLGFESGRGSCPEIRCSACGRLPAAEELPSPSDAVRAAG